MLEEIKRPILGNPRLGTRSIHKDCLVCIDHPRFNLDDLVYIHGKYYTKREILEGLRKLQYG